MPEALEDVRPVDLEEIRAARTRIEGTILRTPLIRLELGPEFPEIRLKLENLQPINAYKLRGAANAVAMLSEAAKVDRMTTSQSLGSLERKGYVIRETSRVDRRSYRIALTAEGRRVALKTIKRLADTHTKFFEPVADETEAVVGYLRRLVQANKLP